jgi:hypothetical protein
MNGGPMGPRECRPRGWRRRVYGLVVPIGLLLAVVLLLAIVSRIAG